jgi:hypothetical protein
LYDLSVSKHLRNRYALGPEQQCRSHDDQARRLVEDDCLERRKAEDTQEERESELCATKPDQATQRTYHCSTRKRRQRPSLFYPSHLRTCGRERSSNSMRTIQS